MCYLRYIGIDIERKKLQGWIFRELGYLPRRDYILMFAKSESPETFASSSASEIHDSRVFMF